MNPELEKLTQRIVALETELAEARRRTEAEKLIKQADDALAEAKSQGRNRVIAF